MITAAEARARMPQEKFNAILDALEEQIKAAAEVGKYEIRLGGDLVEFDKGNCYLTALGTRVTDELKGLGFRAEQFYECNQFVDSGYRLSWKPDSGVNK